VEFTLFSFRTRTFITILAYTSVDVASARPASWLIDLTVYFWDGELKFPDNFRSLTDNIFQFKFRL
jgi:hypothetical protein